MIAFLKRKAGNNIEQEISKKNNHENVAEREESAKDGLLPFLIPALARRIGEEGEEKSEEVKLKMLTLLQLLLKHSTSVLAVYVADIQDILSNCLKDSCPEILRMSCEGVSQLATSHPSRLRTTGGALVAPLAKCLTHTQQRTRAGAVEALGAVVLATDGGVWEATVAHLAQRTFDPHPRVRSALVKVIANLLSDFKDRYSYFYQLVPLLLVGLEDEMTWIQEEAAVLWEAVGVQWLEENRMSDSRLKEEEDFLTAPPTFYPPGLERPGLGCRTLVARIQDRIYPSIGNDLKDWTVESRVKAAQLLYRVLWHAEADLVMHLEKIITCLLTAARDEEKVVREYSSKCSLVCGFGIEPKIWSSFLIPRLESGGGKEHLAVLSGLLAGPPPLLLPLLPSLSTSIARDSVCFSLDQAYVAELLKCLEAFVLLLEEGRKGKSDGSNIDENGGVVTEEETEEDMKMVEGNLLKICLAVIGFGEGKVREGGRRCLSSLANGNMEELLKCHLPALLAIFLTTSPTWSSVSYEKRLFEAVLHECPSALGHFPKEVVDIFRDILSNEKEPESRLQSFILLSKMMLSLDSTLNSQGLFSPYLQLVVKDILIPGLKWKAGRTAQAVRTAASASIWSCLVASASNCETLLPLVLQSWSSILGLLDDDSEKTRYYALRSLNIALSSSGPGLPVQMLAKCKVVGGRLEDSDSLNREEAVRCTSALISYVEEHARDEANLIAPKEVLLQKLLLHMDDQSQDFRIMVCIKYYINVDLTRFFQVRDMLKGIPDSLKPALKTKLTKAQDTHVHKKEVQELLSIL